jgi:hypothetical protein
VTWSKKARRWQAQITGIKKLFLGYFATEEEAARQFDRAAIKLRGKKANPNFEYAGGSGRVGGVLGCV